MTMKREELIERARRKETLMHTIHGPQRFFEEDGQAGYAATAGYWDFQYPAQWSLPEPKRLTEAEWRAVGWGEKLVWHGRDGKMFVIVMTAGVEFSASYGYWTRASETPSCVLAVVGSCSCGRCAGKLCNAIGKVGSSMETCERPAGHTGRHTADCGRKGRAESASPTRYPGTTQTDPYAEHNSLEERRWKRRPPPLPCPHCGCNPGPLDVFEPSLGYVVRRTSCVRCGGGV